MNILEVVRAGAGSGKTTDLCQSVAEAVARGLDPARILATTFTKRAAAELKGRIQARLLAASDRRAEAHQHARRLELAAIGTVHSVAHQLLTRYAIEMGLSPRLEVIAESARERALRELLATIPTSSWQPLVEFAERLGINDLRSRILNLLAAKRENRIGDSDLIEQIAASADRVCKLLAPSGVDTVETPISQLYDLAEQALTNINALNDTQKNTNTARQRLSQLKSRQIPYWGSYLEAIRISAGKTSGADAMLDTLRNHASQVRQNPKLHDDLRHFSNLLAEETIRLELEYRVYKAERGLADFTDLEIMFLDLLENKGLAAYLAADFDLVLVDEFQDTNPLQLAIFQRLRDFSSRSRWVGDPKQAIYGFRGTDPELVNRIWDNAPNADRRELPDNHRSQRGLVQLVGTLFHPVFGDDARQEPQKPAVPRGVERWIFDTKNQQDDAIALACGVAELHREGTRFGDIVVMERTNRLLSSLSAAFDVMGIPYLLESPGLMDTREAALLLAGLGLVLDRGDSLAAATVLHFLSDAQQGTPSWIGERLQALHDAQNDTTDDSSFHIPWKCDSRLSRIESIDRTLSSPTLAVHQVIEALNLPVLVQKWGDPGQRCSNIDSFLQHTREYEEMAFDTGQGATLAGLILYLEQLATDQRDYRYPPQGHDAVTLLTYHSAKGLEWPIVVLSGLDSKHSPDMWSPAVSGGGQADADPLKGRILRSWTWPFGETQGQFGRLRTGSDLEKDALLSPEGQDRAAREAEESLRLLYVGCTRAREKLILAHRDGRYSWLSRLDGVDSLLDPQLSEGEHELDGIDTSFVVRRLNAAMADECRVQRKVRERWLSMRSDPNPVEFTVRFHSPSKELADQFDVVPQIQELPGPSYFPSGAEEHQCVGIGNAVHSYLAALPSVRSLCDEDKNRVAGRCLSGYSVTGLLAPAVLVLVGRRFCGWVEENYPKAQWHTEVVVTAPRATGGQWSGIADLLLQLPDGDIIVIDHKSAPIRREQCLVKAAAFAPQLHAYQEAITAASENVLSTCIHFPMAGVIATLTEG